MESPNAWIGRHTLLYSLQVGSNSCYPIVPVVYTQVSCPQVHGVDPFGLRYIWSFNGVYLGRLLRISGWGDGSWRCS